MFNVVALLKEEDSPASVNNLVFYRLPTEDKENSHNDREVNYKVERHLVERQQSKNGAVFTLLLSNSITLSAPSVNMTAGN